MPAPPAAGEGEAVLEAVQGDSCLYQLLGSSLCPGDFTPMRSPPAVGSGAAVHARCKHPPSRSCMTLTDQDTRWNAITAFDVLTEALLLALSVYLVWSVKMRLKQKAAVIFAFAMRAR